MRAEQIEQFALVFAEVKSFAAEGEGDDITGGGQLESAGHQKFSSRRQIDGVVELEAMELPLRHEV